MVSAQPAANEKLMIKPTNTLKMSTRNEKEICHLVFVEINSPNVNGDNAREQEHNYSYRQHQCV